MRGRGDLEFVDRFRFGVGGMLAWLGVVCGSAKVFWDRLGPNVGF